MNSLFSSQYFQTENRLQTTVQVANNYGVSESAISKHFSRNKDEIIEGIHYLLDTNSKFGTKTIKWTLEGVYMLGFFVKKSKVAKEYRSKVAKAIAQAREKQLVEAKETRARNLALVDKVSDLEAYAHSQTNHHNHVVAGYQSQIAQHNALIVSLKKELKRYEGVVEAQVMDDSFNGQSARYWWGKYIGALGNNNALKIQNRCLIEQSKKYEAKENKSIVALSRIQKDAEAMFLKIGAVMAYIDNDKNEDLLIERFYNEYTNFKNTEFEVRVVVKDNEPLFCLADVCKILELDGVNKVANAIKTEFELGELNTASFDTGYGVKEFTMITEAELYFVLMRSDKPKAKPFRMWVNSEVLPSIRKHGAYMTPETIEQALLNPDMLITLATTLKVERAKREALEAERAANLPYVSFGKSVEASIDSVLIGNYAKLLSDSEGVSIGEKRLFEWLRANGYLITGGARHNVPYQKYVDNGYFEVTTQTFAGSTGAHQRFTTKITGKGQIALAGKIVKAFKEAA